MITEVVVIRFSHCTQCLITTSVDITFINLATVYYVYKSNCLRSLCHITIYQEAIFFFRQEAIIIFIQKDVLLYLADMEGCRNKVFSSQAMSHCYKLRQMPSVLLHLKQFFCFYLYLNIKKVILLLKTNNLYKLQTFFLIKATLSLIS